MRSLLMHYYTDSIDDFILYVLILGLGSCSGRGGGLGGG